MSMLTRKGTLSRKSRRGRNSSLKSRQTQSYNKTSSNTDRIVTFCDIGNGGVSTKLDTTELPIPRLCVTHSVSSNINETTLVKNTSPLEKQFYDSTVIWPGVEECEQNYSLMNSICEAGSESSGLCEFLYRAFTIISTTWPVTVLLVILLALPLVMTSIGVNYLHDCPKEPKLPIYQVVGGIFGIIKVLFLLWKQVKKHKDDVGEVHDEDDLGTMIRMTNIALNVFLTLWFIFGHYWLFSIWKPQFEAPLHEPRNWCDHTVFFFTFWQIVICHTIIACLLVVVIILFYCYCCLKCLMDENKS